MNLHTCILTENACYKAGKRITPKGIMVHSTGCDNPNLKRYVGPDDGKLGENPYANHWNTPYPGGSSVCVHAFVGRLADGSVAAYQTLPWDTRGWHCGNGSKGSANDTHLSFEICEDDLTDPAYFSQAYQESVALCAYLCDRYGFDPSADGVLICHSEGHARGIASNHGDVTHWFPRHGKSMDAFRSDVKNALAERPGGDNQNPPALYRVRRTWEDSASQQGAYRELDNAKQRADETGLTVYDQSGTPLYPAPGGGYQVGDTVTVSSYYAASTDPIDKAILPSTWRTAQITRVHPGSRNPYLVGDLGWCNDGDIRSADPQFPAPAPSPDKPYGPAPQIVWDYHYDGQIRQLQKILAEKGANLALDGKAGDKTYQAVRNHTIRGGDRGPLTRWVQERLSAMGFDCGATDGIAGTKTMRGIARLQSANGLDVGCLGGTSWYYVLIG